VAAPDAGTPGIDARNETIPVLPDLGAARDAIRGRQQARLVEAIRPPLVTGAPDTRTPGTHASPYNRGTFRMVDDRRPQELTRQAVNSSAGPISKSFQFRPRSERPRGEGDNQSPYSDRQITRSGSAHARWGE
jgi:hypothetical protein